MRSVLILDYVGLYLRVPICLHVVTINTMNMAVLEFLYILLYFHYICFLYMSCCFGIILILNQTTNLSNYSKHAAITPTTSISTDKIEPLL